jgi:hypothetical protein
MEQTWVGEGTPIGASEAVVEAYHNRLDRSPSTGDIDITVVCNDPRMTAEKDIVDEVYGSRADVPFDVDVHREVTVDRLAELLEADPSFFHYIGHVDEDGFDCADGALDAATLDRTGVDAFFLNACTSYEQGKSLIRAGSVGGVVTLNEVINDAAVEIGSLMARLLNAGFPLRPALEIARDEHLMGSQYLVVGDGSVSLAQPPDTIPYLCEVSPGDDGYETALTTYATRGALGTILTPYYPGEESYHLVPGDTPTRTLDRTALREFLRISSIPVRLGDELYWSDEVVDLL